MSPEQATAEKEIDRPLRHLLARERAVRDARRTTAASRRLGAADHHEDHRRAGRAGDDVSEIGTAERVSGAGKGAGETASGSLRDREGFAEALGNAGFRVATAGGAPGFAGRGVRSRAFAGAAAASGLLLLAAVWGWVRPPAEAPVIRYRLQLASGVSAEAAAPAPVPAPDGAFIVLHGPEQGGRTGEMLWIKRRDSQSATPIAGTEGAGQFAISPNGEWIAFASGQKLSKVQIVGGAPVTLLTGEVDGTFRLTWLEDGTIVFVRSRRGRPSLAQVPATGGEPTDVWRSDSAGGVMPRPISGTHAILFERCTPPPPATSGQSICRASGLESSSRVPGLGDMPRRATSSTCSTADCWRAVSIAVRLPCAVSPFRSPTALTRRCPRSSCHVRACS